MHCIDRVGRTGAEFAAAPAEDFPPDAVSAPTEFAWIDGLTFLHVHVLRFSNERDLVDVRRSASRNFGGYAIGHQHVKVGPRTREPNVPRESPPANDRFVDRRLPNLRAGDF